MDKTGIKKRLCRMTAICVCLLFAGRYEAWGVGSGATENPLFSAKHFAEGLAGTATPDEPAAISYNPAGIADLVGFQVQTSVMGVMGWSFYENKDRGNVRYGGHLNVVPTQYITYKPAQEWAEALTFGIGFDSPFGLSRKMPSTEQLFTYTGFRGQLMMLSVKPTLAVKVNDHFSIGGGPVYNTIMDYGAILHYPNVFLGPFADGQARVSLSGAAWSWQAGALYKANERHAFGFYFRSPFVARLKGKVKVENSVVDGGRDFETPVNTKLGFPFNMTVGYAFSPRETTRIMLDVGYTRWSSIERIIINSDPTGFALDDAILAAIGTNNIKYRDAYSLNFGLSEEVSRRLTLRGGALFLWSPTPNATFSPMTPDANRLAFTGGFGYRLARDTTLDFIYGLSLSLPRKVDNDGSETLTSTTMDGKYISHTHLLGLSVTVKK